ncbi:MAG TPA: hypothetical protein DET40_14980 [Lentisphaeria bacterium]|nr:MAG: hypothetical protein A2X45_13295 [Lentisphaerae bacterium GWF2_50_93]HCE44842.1 hypothetical protein [Lentisphaeria bacterium]
MKKILARFYAGNEKGIALLFTLGILSVLLVIALSFATTAITERKAAANNNDLTVARMLAESAVNRAIGAMKYSTILAPTADYDGIISHYESAAADLADDPVKNRETFDFLWKLGTVIDGTTIYEWPKATYDRATPGAVHWQYIDNGLTGSDKKLIGRIAYVVVGAGGKLDPAACVNQTVAVDEGASYGGNLGDMQDRDGKLASEISIFNLDQNASTYLPAATVTNFSYQPLVGSGKLATARWADWETMFAPGALNIAAPAQKTQFQRWFVLNNPKDPEAFWVDLSNDSKDEPAELYHRYNLARYNDANTNGIFESGEETITLANILVDPVVFSASPVTNDGTGIKWLKNYTGLPVATFTTAETRAKQIASNIVDYCDFNSSPTRDSDSDPTYTGNELTPYINEIGVRVACSVASQNLGSGNYQNNYSVTVDLGGEIINIYSGKAVDLNQTAYIHVLEGNVTYTYLKPDGTTDTRVIPLTNQSDAVGMTTNAGGYKFRWFKVINNAFSTPVVNAPSAGAEISNVKVQITKVLLNYGGDITATNFADFSKPDAMGEYSLIDPTTTPCGIGAAFAPAFAYFFSYQALDPRQNLNNGDWAQAKTGYAASTGLPVEYDVVGTSAAAVGGVNTGIVPFVGCPIADDPDGDIRLAAAGRTPTTLSTAYIRNAPMKSPWELGFIHRGAKWETLNIHTYNSDDDNNGVIAAAEHGVLNTFGIGEYTDGDANILDQVKITNETEVYGKVNVQAARNDPGVDGVMGTGDDDPSPVLRALFGYVRVGAILPNNGTDGAGGTADDNAPGSRNDGAGTLVDWGTDGLTIVNGIITFRATTPFKTRAQMVRTPELTNCASQTTKATRDEIIGKVVNLAKVSSADTLTIVAIAQSIRDVGSPFASSGVLINKDLNQDGTVDAATDIAATAYNVGYLYDADADGSEDDPSYNAPPIAVDEAINACKLGQYDLGADEILAEQKVVVQVFRDTITHKWKILRYEYIDQ